MNLAIKIIIFLFLMVKSLPADSATLEGKVEVPGKGSSENIVVYVEGLKGTYSLPKKRSQMNHVNLQFKPGVLAIMKGSTVDFPNSDAVFHSGFSISKANPFDLGIYGQGTEKFVYFKNPGLDELFCHIHSHMHAYVLSLDNPFFAITDKDGSYTISDIPEGNYTVQAWASPTVNMKKEIRVKDSTTLNYKLLP